MPISQERMIAVLNAGNLWENSFRGAKDEHGRIYEQVLQGLKTPEEALALLQHTFYIHTPEVEMVRALIEETIRFKLTRDKNDYERKRQANRRAEKLRRPLPFPKVLKVEKLREISERSGSRANPLENAMQGVTQGDLDAYKRGELMPEAYIPPEKEGARTRIVQGAKGETIEYTVTQTQSDGSDGLPPSSVDFDDSNGSVI